MALPPSFLDELRQRTSITRVVERRVRLTKRGHEATGLCPFHKEKSPSFTVSELKGFYHCFGCGAHGDAINFVMAMEGLEFREAVERLAAEAGLSIPRDTAESKAKAEHHKTLGSVMELACRWFQEQLHAPVGRAGLDYLQKRGLEPEAIANFRLGFAPESRTGLKTALAKANLSESLAIEAGLLIEPEGGGPTYDRFRNRVMFPILDLSNRVIAFGGRALGEDKPKYLNSPETSLFHKGQVLYNLGRARKSARDQNEILVVEGYMDAIAVSMAGIPHVVAPLGTALTEQQLDLLWRQASEPILCFDGDEAGMRAAERAAMRALPLLKPGLSLRFAWMPEGFDPDSLIRTEGVKGITASIAKAEPLVNFLWRLLLLNRPLDTPERRSGFRRDLKDLALKIAEPSIRDSYGQEFDQRYDSLFRSPKNIGGSKSQNAMRYRQDIGGIGGESARRGVAGLKRAPYELILAVLIHHPDLIHVNCEAIGEINFPEGELDRVKRAVIDLAARQQRLELLDLKNQLIDQGFLEFLEGLEVRTRHVRFTLPSADRLVAEEGLRHVIEMLHERDHLKPEFRASGSELSATLDQAQNVEGADLALAKFEALRNATLGGESQRSDVDRIGIGLSNKIKSKK